MNKNKNQTSAINSLTEHRCFLAISILVLLGVSVFNCAAQAKKRIRISAIQAKIFYNNSGTFSEDAVNGNVDLWNSPFDSSYSTLVLVELDGLPEYLDPTIRIELTARYIPFHRMKRSLVVRQIETIHNGSETGKAYAGFWLKKTGCHPVYLMARIVGRRQPLVKETINFGCGE